MNVSYIFWCIEYALIWTADVWSKMDNRIALENATITYYTNFAYGQEYNEYDLVDDLELYEDYDDYDDDDEKNGLRGWN